MSDYSELCLRTFLKDQGKLFDEKYMKSRIMQKNFKRETLEKYREVSLECL